MHIVGLDALRRRARDRERAERAGRALRESRARHDRHRAVLSVSREARTVAVLPATRLTAEEFAAWLADRDASLADVLVYYLSIGGACSSFELDAFVNNALDLPDAERAVLRHALWELDEFSGTI